jgi:hypothetical protein
MLTDSPVGLDRCRLVHLNVGTGRSAPPNHCDIDWNNVRGLSIRAFGGTRISGILAYVFSAMIMT